MIAIGALLSFEILALAVAGAILFYAVIDLVTGLIWRDADRPAGRIEDVSSNQERER